MEVFYRNFRRVILVVPSLPKVKTVWHFYAPLKLFLCPFLGKALLFDYLRFYVMKWSVKIPTLQVYFLFKLKYPYQTINECIYNCIFMYLEPVGSVAPRFPNGDTFRGFTTESRQNLTLLCPAQAFPVPFFR